MVTQESESGLDQLQKGKKLEWETSWIVGKFWAWVSPGAESILSLSWAHLQLQKCKEKKKKPTLFISQNNFWGCCSRSSSMPAPVPALCRALGSKLDPEPASGGEIPRNRGEAGSCWPRAIQSDGCLAPNTAAPGAENFISELNGAKFG